MDTPKIKSMEIVPAKPEPADQRRLAHLRATTDQVLDPMIFVVKVYLEQPMPATGSGFPLFVGGERIGKYTAFPGGVYFKVHTPTFLEAHRGEPVRFVAEAEPQLMAEDAAAPKVSFPANTARVSANDVDNLPSLHEVLMR